MGCGYARYQDPNSRFVPTNHNISMLVARCLNCWWLNTLPTTLNEYGYIGTLIKYRFSILQAGGHIRQRANMATFVPIMVRTVEAAGGTSRAIRFSGGGGL